MNLDSGAQHVFTAPFLKSVLLILLASYKFVLFSLLVLEQVTRAARFGYVFQVAFSLLWSVCRCCLWLPIGLMTVAAAHR